MNELIDNNVDNSSRRMAKNQNNEIIGEIHNNKEENDITEKN